MTVANMSDRTLAAAGLVLVYAMVIGFTDNYVQVIAADAGLWQFHATRSVMAWAILLALMLPFGLGSDRAICGPWWRDRPSMARRC